MPRQTFEGRGAPKARPNNAFLDDEGLRTPAALFPDYFLPSPFSGQKLACSIQSYVARGGGNLVVVAAVVNTEEVPTIDLPGTGKCWIQSSVKPKQK